MLISPEIRLIVSSVLAVICWSLLARCVRKKGMNIGIFRWALLIFLAFGGLLAAMVLWSYRIEETLLANIVVTDRTYRFALLGLMGCLGVYETLALAGKKWKWFNIAFWIGFFLFYLGMRAQGNLVALYCFMTRFVILVSAWMLGSMSEVIRKKGGKKAGRLFLSVSVLLWVMWFLWIGTIIIRCIR